MSTARSATISPNVTVTPMCGTKSPCDPTPIEASTSTEYTNVPTNVPRVSWVPRSRMKFRSIRGPNWVDASVRVTRMMEKTTPTTVMMAGTNHKLVRSTSRRQCEASADEGKPRYMFGILSWEAALSLDGGTMSRPVAHLANLDLNLLVCTERAGDRPRLPLVPSPGQTASGSAFTTLNRHK